MEKFNVEVGGQSSEKLKGMYSGSYFLSPEFDGAIMGVNPLTDSVIYHLFELITITMQKFTEDDIEEMGFDEDDLYDHCQEIVFGEFNLLENQETLVAPTLFQELMELDN